MDSARGISPLFPSSGNLQSLIMGLHEGLDEDLNSQTSSVYPPPAPCSRSRPPSPEPSLSFLNTEAPEDYRLICQIGLGGYGQVHKARNLVTSRVCAIKVIPLGKKKLLKLLAEPELQSLMSHKNVAVVLGLYCTPTHLNIVQQFYGGGTLRDQIKLAPHYRIDQSLAAWYISQIALGLDHIHNQGVIHRDIKESNIFLLSNGVVKIGDFGIAVAMQPNEANTGYGGTRGWMSPEMILSQPYTYKTDIWSFGVVCYRLITGKRPFLASDGATYSEKILAGAYPSSRHLEGIAGDLIGRFLHVNPYLRVNLSEVDEIPWIQYHICIAGRRKRPRRVLHPRYLN